MPDPLPVELPEPMLPLLEPELGAGEGVVVLGEVVELPEVPPVAAPDLLKWASHSEREICPSLFLSTDEKLGSEVDDAPAEPLDMPVEPLVLLPDAAGEEEDLSLLVLLEDELCATATPESANRAAAVAAVNSFNLSMG